MTPLDWVIIVLYLLGMIGLSAYLGHGQADDKDYYLGGRNLPWWAIGISTMATQTSAISFISIPAFVALKKGGGLTWLQYELALPLAILFTMLVLLPFFRKLELVSVYEYLEHRFGPGARFVISAIFLISRGLGAGVGVYASAIVLSVCLGIPLWGTIMLIGLVTVIYDTIGGMKAVVFSDVIQMFVLIGGLLLCVGYVAAEVGGLRAMFATLDAERCGALDASTGLGDGSETPFWAFLIGGFFLYTSYYGVDQTQVQRELSAPTIADTKRSLVLNGLARFPLTILYLCLGVASMAAHASSPDLQTAVADSGKHDYLVPFLILQQLPPGLRAVLFAAILSAAMSSLDSSLNSLSAATMRDFIEKLWRPPPERLLVIGRVTTVVWGALITVLAFLVGNISETVVEGINKIGSLFYGPVLGAFLAGLLSRRSTSAGVIAGLIAGVSFNLGLWVFWPEVHWMWWNPFGLVATVVTTAIVSRYTIAPMPEQIDRHTLSWDAIRIDIGQWWRTYLGLIVYFFVILAVLVGCTWYATRLGA